VKNLKYAENCGLPLRACLRNEEVPLPSTRQGESTRIPERRKEIQAFSPALGVLCRATVRDENVNFPEMKFNID